MEVKIGIQSVPRELVVETDTPAETIEAELTAVLENGEHSVFTLTTTKGGKVLVPADKIAYVEFAASEGRRVGFGNIVLTEDRRARGYTQLLTGQWNDATNGRVEPVGGAGSRRR